VPRVAKIVAVTGPIAAGATTLAARLAKLAGWKPFLEADVEEQNPFFSLYHLYHADPSRYGFHNQVAFMVQSAESHSLFKLSTPDQRTFVQDFTPFEHIEVYANVQHTLGRISGAEFALLMRAAELFDELYVRPAVLVYRPLSAHLLRARVEARGRPSEQFLDARFLEAVRGRFEEWIREWNRSPVVWASESADYLTDENAVLKLASEVENYLGASSTECA
jgi:deoxyadenosine/deoxycytidine kinase